MQAASCDVSSPGGNWSTAAWSCGHTPTAADNASIMATVVTLDQNVAVNILSISPTAHLNAGIYTITVNGDISCRNNSFNYDTSTVMLTDANHILFNGLNGCTYYNLNMATLTAPRVIKIDEITVKGSFISGTSISNQVSFINWDPSMNGVNTPVRSYYCASNGGMINIDCIPGGPPVLTNLTISNPTQTSLTLNWTDNCQDEDSFILGRATTPGGPYTETVIATGNKAGTGVSQSYNDTGVTCGMTYYYVVKTRLNPATDSTNSTEVNASTSACSPTTYTFSTTTAGIGTGNLTGSTANGTYPVGTTVVLNATANAGSTFAGWSPASCVTGMTLNADTTCTATFNLMPMVPVTPSHSTPPLPDHLSLFVQVDGSGQGRVETDTGLSCLSSDCQTNEVGERKCDSQVCTQVVKTTSYVTLTPHTDADSVFSSWGGHEDCIDGEVFMNSSKLCIAYFRRLYPLTITIQGAGLVQGFGGDQQPMGIDCGTECEATYSAGTTVYLQATPATGQEFLGWGGDCEGMQNPLAVEVTQETTCEARFGVREVPPAPAATEPKPVTPEPGDTTTVTPPPVTEETTPVVPGTTETTPGKPATTETVPVVPETTETVPVVPETTETVPVVPETTETAPVVPETTTSPVTETPSPVVVSDTPAAVTTPTTVVLPPPWFGNTFLCATTGTIDQVCNYGGRSVTQLEVQSHGMVSNGVLTSTLVNTGWVSNFTITRTGELRSGVVTGYLKNDGIMLDFDFKGMSIIGGTLGGVITNTSKVGGYFQDVTLQANTKITGGSLKGSIKGDKNHPALLENVRIKSGSKLSGVKLGKNVKLEKGVVVEK